MGLAPGVGWGGGVSAPPWWWWEIFKRIRETVGKSERL